MTKVESDLALVERAFEQLHNAALSNSRALVLLADQARRRGDIQKAFEIARAALALDPKDPEIVFSATSTISNCIPGWHIPLVHDIQRNNAFEAALVHHIRPGIHVLDIGAGTGLLSMMAARAGAGHVFSCELNPAMAEVAAQIVSENGYADRICILPKHSTEVDPDQDMRGRADLIVAEILGSDLVCENVLPTMRDAVTRLAKPGARIIPAGGDIVVALASWGKLKKQKMDKANGFDLRKFNRLIRPKFSIKIGDPALKLLGPAKQLFSFNFSSISMPPDVAEVELISHGGSANGIVQWIRLRMDDKEALETRPEKGAKSSWDCNFFPFPEPLATNFDEGVRVAGTHKGNRLKIWRVAP